MATFIDRVVKSETRYEPGPLPENAEDLGNYLLTELKRIGNIFLNQEALKVADKISKIDSKSAQWIASDAKKELNSEKVFSRFDT